MARIGRENGGPRCRFVHDIVTEAESARRAKLFEKPTRIAELSPNRRRERPRSFPLVTNPALTVSRHDCAMSGSTVASSIPPAFVDRAALASAPLRAGNMVAVDDVPKLKWGTIWRKPAIDAKATIHEADVLMRADKSCFLVNYPDGRQEFLSSNQFCSLVVALNRTKLFAFVRPDGKKDDIQPTLSKMLETL